jgi:hypothetical protein
MYKRVFRSRACACYTSDLTHVKPANSSYVDVLCKCAASGGACATPCA